ncbi:ribonuclease H-like domain-containing protein [Tanacetum coccineum]
MYSFDLKNVVPSGGLTCLFAKAIIDESNHKRLGHINFKTLNKLVKGNLVRGLPSKLFENDHTCVASQKGKQHKASCKTKLFRGMKGIKRGFSVARTPQQNRVAERKNMTLIEAARTMLADSLLPTTFWAKAVSTACYVQNRVLSDQGLHTKTPNELLHDPLGKFDVKADEGSFVEYSINSTAVSGYLSLEQEGGWGCRNQLKRKQVIKDKVVAVPTQLYILLIILIDSSKSLRGELLMTMPGKKTNENNQMKNSQGSSVTPPDEAWSEYVSEGVTS